MASIGFRWLDILEKEFDKAFVDLDLAIGTCFNLINVLTILLIVYYIKAGYRSLKT